MNGMTSAVRQPAFGSPAKFYVPSFHFDLVKPCYCNSGQLFGQCCANPSANQESPNGIHVIKDFIPTAECKRFLRFAEKQKRSWLSVVDTKKTTNNKPVHKRDSSRITQQVMLGKKQAQANEWFQAATTQIGQLTSAKPQWFEAPHLLRYGPGGKYSMHSDSDHFDIASQRFYRFIDRDFSMLIYLNDDFEGGELKFPWLNYQYTPVAGDLVIFPSNHLYTHESLPIKSRNKYALVSWGAFNGTPRVAQPRSMIRL